MQYYRFSFLLLLCLFLKGLTAQDAVIFPKGTKAPNVHHTGDVWLYHVSNAGQGFDYNIATATFAPGAKLDWHLHPAGQRLLITEGMGYYQERDQPVRIVRKGEAIECTPGVEHWHAATPKSGVTYLAITGNQKTQWKEPVTDEEFQAINADELLELAIKEEVIQLSKKKWQWMADKDVTRLNELFHPNSVFVHMGGSWGKDREIEIIKSGNIHYKKADIHEASVEIIDDTAVLLNRITLLAVVGGNEVTNPFMVTEVYKKMEGHWKLASLSFTKLL